MGAMKVWDGTTWQTVAPFSERASVFVGPDQPAGATYAGDLWWDTDDPAPSMPGQELAYNEITANVSITSITSTAADLIVTAPAVMFDGVTPVFVEFYARSLTTPNTGVGSIVQAWLYQDGSVIGSLGLLRSVASATAEAPFMVARRLTPSAGSHTYSIRGTVSSGTGSVTASTGGGGTVVPAFIRVTRV